MHKILVSFDRTLNTPEPVEVEVARIPIELDKLQVSPDDAARSVRSVIIVANPKPGNVVAFVRVK